MSNVQKQKRASKNFPFFFKDVFKVSFTLEELEQQNDVGDTIDLILKKI